MRFQFALIAMCYTGCPDAAQEARMAKEAVRVTSLEAKVSDLEIRNAELRTYFALVTQECKGAADVYAHQMARPVPGDLVVSTASLCSALGRDVSTAPGCRDILTVCTANLCRARSMSSRAQAACPKVAVASDGFPPYIIPPTTQP